MDGTVRSVLAGTAPLILAAGLALLLALFRRPIVPLAGGTRGAVRVFGVLVLLQALHAVEEYATRFYEAYPEVLGLASWPADFFLAFNLCWLAVWTAAAITFPAGYRLAFFAAWFLAIAGMANGIVHPLLAVVTGGYFPGLLTSPLVGIGGILLWRRLMAITIAEARGG
jgi:hypothetical protein